jgi:hypothetical protein
MNAPKQPTYFSQSLPEANRAHERADGCLCFVKKFFPSGKLDSTIHRLSTDAGRASSRSIVVAKVQYSPLIPCPFCGTQGFPAILYKIACLAQARYNRGNVPASTRYCFTVIENGSDCKDLGITMETTKHNVRESLTLLFRNTSTYEDASLSSSLSALAVMEKALY